MPIFTLLYFRYYTDIYNTTPVGKLLIFTEFFKMDMQILNVIGWELNMKMNIKGLMLGFAAFAMAVSTVVSTAQPAAAVGPCGPSYTKVGSYNMAAGNAKGGTLEIYWSNTKKNNCAVARCYDWTCGYGVHREVYISRTNDSSWNDWESGWNWVSYAGPVYSYNSVGRCITAQARFYAGVNSNYGTARIEGKHCG